MCQFVNVEEQSEARHDIDVDLQRGEVVRTSQRSPVPDCDSGVEQRVDGSGVVEVDDGGGVPTANHDVLDAQVVVTHHVPVDARGEVARADVVVPHAVGRWLIVASSGLQSTLQLGDAGEQVVARSPGGVRRQRDLTVEERQDLTSLLVEPERPWDRSVQTRREIT